MPKQVYTWGKVKPGDIISFRYTGKGTAGYLTTLLVLNPRMPHKRKDNTKTFHLIGLKLESKGNIPTIRNKPILVQILERIGEVKIIDIDNDIYRVNIKGVGVRGARPAIYKKIKRYLNKFLVYRTYDYKEARKSQVFLEPIVLPKEFKEVLIEDFLRDYST